MNQITSDKPLKFSCCVCGQPTGTILNIPVPGGGSNVCKTCHQTACPQCYVKGKNVCTRCNDERGWCKPPGLPLP